MNREKYLLEAYEPGHSIENTEILEQHAEIFRRNLHCHTHDFYEFTMVEEGDAIHFVNDHYCRVGRGSLTFVRASDYHCFTVFNTEKYTMFNIRLSAGEFAKIDEFMRGIPAELTTPELPVSVRIPETSLTRYASTIRELNRMSPSPRRGVELKILFCDMFMELYKSGAERKDGGFPAWLNSMLERLAAEYDQEIDPAELARSSGISREHMCRSFRRYLGVSLTQYVNSLRTYRAAWLLRNTDREIADIGCAVGFNNLGYFYKEFTISFNMAPGEYRKAVLRSRAGKSAGVLKQVK